MKEIFEKKMPFHSQGDEWTGLLWPRIGTGGRHL